MLKLPNTNSGVPTLANNAFSPQTRRVSFIDTKDPQHQLTFSNAHPASSLVYLGVSYYIVILSAWCFYKTNNYVIKSIVAIRSISCKPPRSLYFDGKSRVESAVVINSVKFSSVAFENYWINVRLVSWNFWSARRLTAYANQYPRDNAKHSQYTIAILYQNFIRYRRTYDQDATFASKWRIQGLVVIVVTEVRGKRKAGWFSSKSEGRIKEEDCG